MDADGNIKNVKLKKKKESPPSNFSIPRTFSTDNSSLMNKDWETHNRVEGMQLFTIFYNISLFLFQF
jgi:hypothetical protein